MRIYTCASTPPVPRPAWASAAGSRATTPPGPIRHSAIGRPMRSTNHRRSRGLLRHRSVWQHDRHYSPQGDRPELRSLSRLSKLGGPAHYVARSAADGHTLAMGHIGTLAVNPALYPKLPYDPLKSFEPVTGIANVHNMLAVHPDVPARTLQELIDYAKQNPGKLNYATGGIGSAAHIATAALADRAGISMTHVPYKGTAPAVTDLLGGRVQLAFTGAPTLMQHIEAGKLRALAVSGTARLRAAPTVPTVAESGLPG